MDMFIFINILGFTEGEEEELELRMESVLRIVSITALYPPEQGTE